MKRRGPARKRGFLYIKRDIKPGWRLKIVRVSPLAPLYWRRITQTGGIESWLQKRDWTLVLSAVAVPYLICRQGGIEHIYVPPLYEKLALGELELFARENRRPQRERKSWPLYHSWPFAPLYLAPLILWHGMRVGWWAAPQSLPALSRWQEIGALDSIKLLLHGQWARLATALDIHSGMVHLTGNLFFGAFFLILLARLCGLGHAWLITLLGGVMGNGLSVLIHDPGYASVGFSTSVFAAVGAIAGILFWRATEKILMPFAAALAFLSMLGVEGANTDYVAHICGLVCGCLLGAIEGYAYAGRHRLLPQALAALLAIAIPCVAWAWAFDRY